MLECVYHVHVCSVCASFSNVREVGCPMAINVV